MLAEISSTTAGPRGATITKRMRVAVDKAFVIEYLETLAEVEGFRAGQLRREADRWGGQTDWDDPGSAVQIQCETSNGLVDPRLKRIPNSSRLC
jgi:hypothetical protein